MGGDSRTLTLPPTFLHLVVPLPELALRHNPGGLAMRVVAGLSFPSCGSSAELRTKASHKRMGSVERIRGQWPVGDGIWRMVAEAVGAALGRQVGLRRLPPSPLCNIPPA
jgi:hypothetical protein